MICPQEANVNCFGQIVTRFISTALLELNDVEITDKSGMRAMIDNRMRITVMEAPNAFSRFDSNMSTRAPHPKTSSIAY